jgi:hypothetical protein
MDGLSLHAKLKNKTSVWRGENSLVCRVYSKIPLPTRLKTKPEITL